MATAVILGRVRALGDGGFRPRPTHPSFLSILHMHRILIRPLFTPAYSRTFTSTGLRSMPSSNESAVNRSGLTPTESKALPEREPSDEEKKIIASVSEVRLRHLFNCDAAKWLMG